MKFWTAILVYLLMGFVLGCGVLLTVRGNPWLLIVSFVVYAIAFARLGCLPGKMPGH